MWKVKLLIQIVVSWMLIGMLLTLYDYLTLASLKSAGFSNLYHIRASLGFNVGIGLTGGLIGGGFLIFFVNEKYRDEPYWKSIALIILCFVMISSSLVVLISLLQAQRLENGQEFWTNYLSFLKDPGNLKDVLAWLLIFILTQLVLQVNDKFGQNTWFNFLIGKYHRPKEEARIFLFVDLISCTTIAERIGHVMYHNFLKDYFADITTSIIRNKGEIYQYIGDEVVISWKISSKSGNDLWMKCYYEMRKTVELLSDKYNSIYGFIPEFKAGAHFGKVIVGEIGLVKRELTFSGDVLNTTSRIQGKCNELKVRILVSEELLSLTPANHLFRRVPLGNIELRGKNKIVRICTLISV